MFASNAPFTKEGFAAVIRELERQEQLLTGSRQGDMGTSTGTNLGPLSADQTTDGDGTAGSPLATLADLTAANPAVGGDLSGTVSNATIKPGVVTKAKMANGSACSIIGRSANTSGVEADIAAASNGQLCKRAGDAIKFARFPGFTVNTVVTSGTSYTVPADTYRIMVVMVSGGGGQSTTQAQAFWTASASGGSPTQQTFFTGGYGGSGGIEFVYLDVSPGDTISYTIGAAGTDSTTPTAGGDTTLTYNAITYTVTGGLAGGDPVINRNVGAGGNGGKRSDTNANSWGLVGIGGAPGSIVNASAAPAGSLSGGISSGGFQSLGSHGVQGGIVFLSTPET